MWRMKAIKEKGNKEKEEERKKGGEGGGGGKERKPRELVRKISMTLDRH